MPTRRRTDFNIETGADGGDDDMLSPFFQRTRPFVIRMMISADDGCPQRQLEGKVELEADLGSHRLTRFSPPVTGSSVRPPDPHSTKSSFQRYQIASYYK